MRSYEFEARKKPAEPKAGDTTTHDYDPGWDTLNWLKESAFKMGKRLQETEQLFMPRPHAGAQTNRNRRLANLANYWAWDEADPAKLKPQYAKWQGDIDEAAPILIPGQVVSPKGNNKPRASLWTSTARRFDNNTYTSDWVRWVYNSQPAWMSPVGYLYKVKPNSLILPLDGDHDAEQVRDAYANMGRSTFAYTREASSSDFPWDEVTKHFDGVHHYPYGSRYDTFMYGWDCESTAWFNTNQLILIGEVKINQHGLDPNDRDDDY